MPDTISNNESLEQHFGEPLELALATMREDLDQFQSRFIELSPFACIATADASGQPTISPRGDAPGFVSVIDKQTLLMPDRMGNNKVESFHNLVQNPKMAIIFMVPGLRETLRISGEASITTDQALLEPSQVANKAVRTGLLVKITKAYFHCGKAMIRSKIWDDDNRLKAGEFPSFGEIIKAEAKLDESSEQMEQVLEDAYRNELY